jgi:hypothetical protein
MARKEGKIRSKDWPRMHTKDIHPKDYNVWYLKGIIFLNRR